MRITIEKDDGSEQVFQDVTDYAINVRQWIPGLRNETPTSILAIRSFSHTSSKGGLREVIKEMRQSILEMQRLLEKEM